MASNFRKFKKGISIEPVTGSTVTVEGEIAYNDTSNQLEVFGASAAESITTTSNTQTLTNKTLSGNTATNLVSGSGTLTLNTSGTATVPNATDTLVGKATTDTFTNKTFDVDGTGNSLSNVANANIKAAAAIALNKLAATTASRALVSDGSGFVSASSVTSTELGYVSGVSSAIQTQLNAKAPTASPTFSGTITTPLTASRALVTGASSELAVSAVTATELGYVSGVTSAIQTQINNLSASSQTASGDMKNLGLACSVAANALTIALKQADGSTDPSSGSAAVSIGFRNATSATGSYSFVTATGALSLVISSGSTLGHLSATQSYIWVYAINNAGTIELAASSLRFDEGSIVSTTAEGGAGAADSAILMYSTTARSNVAVRLLGRLSSTQATAGTWATAISEISLAPSIKSGEFIGARASNSTTSITSSGVTPIFTTEDFDPHGCFNLTNSEFTCPSPGIYRVSGYALSAASNWTAEGESFQYQVYKNGSAYATLGGRSVESSGPTALRFTASGSTLIKCAATDVLKPVLFSDVTGSLPSGATNAYFEVEKVG